MSGPRLKFLRQQAAENVDRTASQRQDQVIGRFGKSDGTADCASARCGASSPPTAIVNAVRRLMRDTCGMERLELRTRNVRREAMVCDVAAIAQVISLRCKGYPRTTRETIRAGRVEEPLPEAPRWAVPAIAAIASNAAQGDPSQHPSRH